MIEEMPVRNLCPGDLKVSGEFSDNSLLLKFVCSNTRFSFLIFSSKCKIADMSWASKDALTQGIRVAKSPWQGHQVTPR